MNRLFVESFLDDSLKIVRTVAHMACRTFVLLSEHLIWFHDIFKIIDKNHQCRRITSSVSLEITSRGHEEMYGGASGNGAV
ncbi:MAG: hypothetical protein LBI05_04765 [Planctomycetaceae bacterium]|nr:hypothetical protein [Planctomycetaceae bacterium]